MRCLLCNEGLTAQRKFIDRRDAHLKALAADRVQYDSAVTAVVLGQP